jgi:hypothetical protein
VTNAGKGVTKLAFYQAAPGLTDQQLYQKLKAQGVAGLQDPATRAFSPQSSWTCRWGTATTLACPQVHWARNGYGHPQIYFVDHTSSAWPVSAAVPVWNEARGVDSWYRWANCPYVRGTHCVGVYNNNYGDTGWAGLTTIEWDSGRNILDGRVTVYLNDYYPMSGASRRKTTCQQLGHALGMGNNSSANSCLVTGNYTPSRPNGDDFALIADIYRSF